ncbi:Transcriptional regulator, LysR family [Photobacterium marinum]|uniref:Transcriptional regulator, LysR family n=1 Tax=Photobacterium marinum TaxID=1056511 RepID=L8JFC5_9GAMM|nr:LysR family transcriptional regulator [Photobacterium marinum]ELR66204.1 Transcriptional regulator, LysR family [Photobacterium marinum]
MRFSMEQLEAFVASAEAGSFSAGARRLGKAQSVVSTAVANLEADLNQELFDRSGRTPLLTPNGKVLLVKAKRILDECGILLAAADSFQMGVEQKVTLAVESMAMTQTMADQLKLFEAAYPQVEVEILSAGEGDVLKLVREGRAQIAVMLQMESLQPGIEVHGIGTLEMWCIAAACHPLASVSKPKWQDLQQSRQILVTGRYGQDQQRWRVSDAVWQTENAISAMQLVSSGIGWAALPAEMVRDVIESGVLIQLALDFESQPWRQGVDIAWSTQHPMGPASRELLKLLREIRL